MSYRKIKVGITQGDINGIGPEVIVKALADSRIAELCVPIVYGSPKILDHYRRQLEATDFNYDIALSASDATEGRVSVVDVMGDNALELMTPGQPSDRGGRAAFQSLERAIADMRAGDIDVLVTAPICKDTIQSETFCFPGHTEYLESTLGEEGQRGLMLMCSTDGLRVALVTAHTPLSDVPAQITVDTIVERLRTFNLSLHRDFCIEAPRIAVLSLNPHAGENGLLGREETDVLLPALEIARGEKILAFGPYASDGFFGSDAYLHFDGVLAMYHDQGLTPFKTLVMDMGVNFTAGLDYVRTSPDHGTGFDIAGKGIASPESMRQAIYMAIDISRSRYFYDEARRNPLRPQVKERPERRNGHINQPRREPDAADIATE